MKKEFKINTNIKLKKSHVCGSEVWEIKKIGEDSKIKIAPNRQLLDLDTISFPVRDNLNSPTIYKVEGPGRTSA